MSAVADLLRQSTRALFSVLARYWLLVARPAEYYERYIRDKTARDLRKTIAHTLVLATAVALYFGVALGSMKAGGGAASPDAEYIELLLTKQYLLFGGLLLSTAPALLTYYIIYRFLSCPTSDLIFIYFNNLSLWLALFVAYVAFATVLVAITYLFGFTEKFFSALNSLGQPQPLNAPVYWGFFVFISITYYVPLILFERSTRRSTLFASGLCLAGLAVSCVAAFLAMQAAGVSTFPPPAATEEDNAQSTAPPVPRRQSRPDQDYRPSSPTRSRRPRPPP